MALTGIGLASGGCESDKCSDASLFVLVTRWVANGASMGLAIPAGKQRAQYEAAQYARDGAPERDTEKFVNFGAAALTVGTVSWVLLRIGAIVSLNSNRGACVSVSDTCYAGYLAGVQTSFALASAGAGMLSYGLARRGADRALGNEVRLRVMPQASAQYRGLSLGGQF